MQFAQADVQGLWRRRVGALSFIGVPVLTYVIVLVCRALGLDSRGVVHVGSAGTVAAFSLLWAFPLATLAPIVLARLSRRPWSQGRYAGSAALLGGCLGMATGMLLLAPFASPIEALSLIVMPIWVGACAGALGTAALATGLAPEAERARPVDADHLIIRGIAFALVVGLGWLITLASGL